MSKVTPQSPQPQPKNLFQIIETKNSKSVFLFQNKVHTWKTKTGNSINNFAKSKEFIETRRKVEFFFFKHHFLDAKKQKKSREEEEVTTIIKMCGGFMLLGE